MKELETEKLILEYCEHGEGGPVFLLIGGREDPLELTERIAAFLKEDKPFIMACVSGKDGSDTSPWPADTGSRSFSGGGKDLPKQLEKAAELVLQTVENDGRVFTAGYSLAGLAALFALYESEAFAGTACVSGSLWYPGWEAYAAEHRLHQGALVYLSLGGKEHRSPDPLMAGVNECYKRQEKRLREDPGVVQIVFEMNPGGHFSDPQKRLAKGIARLLEM